MNHTDEKILELYVLEAAEVIGQKAEIEQHINICNGCRNLYEEIKSYYCEVNELVEERLQKNTQLITLRSLALKQSIFENRQLSQLPKTHPVRFALFLIRHPLASVMSLAAAIVLGVLFMFPTTGENDTNPDYARARDEFLRVYNKEGDVLWKKKIGIGYDIEQLQTHKHPGSQYYPDEYLKTVDVNGDGVREILAIFGMVQNRDDKNVIYCFNADGSERWRYKFNRSMTFGDEHFPDEYFFKQLLVGDYNNDNSIEIIAVINHQGWYPGVILNIDAHTGKLIGEYWHSGSINGIICKDLDKDGNAEIIATGENNAYDLASLIVLDTRYLSGHSPAPHKYTPQNIIKAIEKYYLLISRSELKKYATHKRNRTFSPRFTSEGSLIISNIEEYDNNYYSIFYTFDSTLICKKVEGEDKFVSLYNKFLADGKLTQKLDEQYFEELRKGVLYWNGEKFVDYSTQNKNYLSAIRQKHLP